MTLPMYNQAFHKLYDTSQPHQSAWSQMQSTYDELMERQHSMKLPPVWLALWTEKPDQTLLRRITYDV